MVLNILVFHLSEFYPCSGLAMSQIELEKIADYFDRDHDGYIDLSEINSILRGIRRARSIAKRPPMSDSEKIDHEVREEPLEKEPFSVHSLHIL